MMVENEQGVHTVDIGETRCGDGQHVDPDPHGTSATHVLLGRGVNMLVELLGTLPETSSRNPGQLEGTVVTP